VQSIRDFVPDMHYVAYTKTPFFDKLNELQGTPNPTRIPIEQFAAARKELFGRQLTEKLKIKDLIATQPVVNGEKVGRNVKENKIKNAAVVRYGGKLFVVDGHHAVAAAAKRGDKKIKAYVLNIGGGKAEQEFYRPDQARGAAGTPEGGQFVPEGGGAGGGEAKAAERKRIPTYKGMPPMADVEMYSPNTGEMGFATALHEMHGPNQDRAHKIAQNIDDQLAMFTKSHDGIGDWSDGAENSVITEVDEATDFDELRYNAALKGKIMNQKAVLAFKVDEKGSDAIYRMTIPNSDLETIRNDLTNAGIQHRTLIPDEHNTDVVVFDFGATADEGVAKVAEKYGTTAQKVRGTGEFVGEADTREAAQANYDKIIQDYETKYPDRRHYTRPPEQRVRDNGSKVGTSRLESQVTEKKLGDGGSSDVFYATFSDGSKGVWKPESGEPESGVRNNVDGPFYQHEAAAYEVAKEIGLDDLVPETIVRDVDGEKGSMQDFVKNAAISWHVDSQYEYDGDTDLMRAAAFDYLIGNTDRHGENWMIGNDDHKMHLIDNGLSFPNNNVTDWAGNRNLIEKVYDRDEAIPTEAKTWVGHLPQIKKIMEARGLGGEEWEGVERRAHDLLKKDRFQQLGSGMKGLGDEPEPSTPSTPTPPPMPTTVRLADSPRLGKAAGKLVHPIERWPSGYTPGGEHTEAGYVVRLPDGSDQRVHQKDVTVVTSAGRQGRLLMGSHAIPQTNKELPIGAKLQPVHNSLVGKNEIMDSKGVIHKKKDVAMGPGTNWSDLNEVHKRVVRNLMKERRQKAGYEY
jgi:hypothetical protein